MLWLTNYLVGHAEQTEQCVNMHVPGTCKGTVDDATVQSSAFPLATPYFSRSCCRVSRLLPCCFLVQLTAPLRRW